MRPLSFIAIILSAFLTPWWFVLPLSCVYALSFPAYELIVLGLMLDAYYGATSMLLPIPIVYTLGAAVVVVLAEAVKPYLSIYDI